MFQLAEYQGLQPEELYPLLLRQVDALLEGEKDAIANMANLSSLLYHSLPEINWVGFYRRITENELVLGPFMGKPACVRIPVGSGVCGTAMARKKTLRVDDVKKFPGHIACDSASRSEIVIPLIKDEFVVGVLDIDAPRTARFREIDQQYLEEIAVRLVQASNFDSTCF